jgi:RNA recognition motif-containing protein
MGKKLYVGNLSYQVDSSELEQLFGQHGTVVSAQIINDRDTGRSKGFGFVEMGSDDEAQAAIAALNGQEHGGRALTVNEARPREDRGGGGGGGGGRGGGGQAGGTPDAKQIFTAGKDSTGATPCGSCHRLSEANTNGTTGPDLDQGLKGKDPAFIKESIVNPDAEVAQGFGKGIMPPNYKSTLSAAEVDALVKFLSDATK